MMWYKEKNTLKSSNISYNADIQSPKLLTQSFAILSRQRHWKEEEENFWTDKESGDEVDMLDSHSSGGKLCLNWHESTLWMDQHEQ